MQIKLLKQLDGTLGRFLAKVLPAPKKTNYHHFNKFLFVRPGGIGDAVHIIPALSELKRHSPDCEIDVLAERRNVGVLKLCPHVKQTYLYDRLPDMLALLGRRYDVIIDTEQWHRLSAVMCRFVRSDWKIGFATNERSQLFTHAVDYSQADYEIRSFFRLLEPLGISKHAVPERFLSIPDTAVSEAAKLLQSYSYDKFFVMAPFASVRERHWAAENFREVAGWCLDQGYGIVVVGGADDSSASEELFQGLDIFNLAGKLSLAGTAAVMERSVLVLSMDSGPLHLAVGVGRPTVSLFGPGIHDKWAPKGEKHVVLNKALPCSPCTIFGTTPPCPINVQCMQQIKAQDVVLAMHGLLKKISHSQRTL